MSAQLSPEDVVRKFFGCYTNGRPEDFDEVVAPDYLDYGHTPPGRGPGGARDDYQNAVKQANAVISYTIDALVADAEMVAAAWTGTLPGGAEIGKGLSLVPHLRRTAPLDPARPDRDHALARILWSSQSRQGSRNRPAGAGSQNRPHHVPANRGAREMRTSTLELAARGL